MRKAILVAMAGAVLAAASPPATPIVIGHRGASGERPEHTLASYAQAIADGADFVEPDLVSTKDHVLVARHENEISGTTDVAAHAEFADRRTTKTIDGHAVTGWFTEDFTLAELKTLRARERLPQLRPQNTRYDGQFYIPTLAEIIALVQAAPRKVGLYPETKHPSYFAAIGLPLEPPLLAALTAAGYTHRGDPIFIQSFEASNLKALRSLTDLSLIQLIETGQSADGVSYDAMLTPAGLAAVATYADGIGPNKDRIFPRDAAGTLLQPTSLVADAHAAGLKVHPWTFRSENYFLPADFRSTGGPAAPGDAAAEYRLLYAAGVDGVFSDYPAAAVAARR
jgi:glycerophosphoryl diester phosphodiesterase